MLLGATNLLMSLDKGFWSNFEWFFSVLNCQVVGWVFLTRFSQPAHFSWKLYNVKLGEKIAKDELAFNSFAYEPPGKEQQQQRQKQNKKHVKFTRKFE